MATTSCREGRRRRMSEVMGELLEESTVNKTVGYNNRIFCKYLLDSLDSFKKV